IADAVNTLLLDEQMERRDREIYETFQFSDKLVPPFKATLGSRVGAFLFSATRQLVAGSSNLATVGALRTLMHGGGGLLREGSRAVTRFGRQIGDVHGGLLYSRTPTRFWHEAPGMLRDVDMVGSYNSVISRMNVYWGRPVIFEPGERQLTLGAAVS